MDIKGMPTIPTVNGANGKSTGSVKSIIGSDGLAGIYWRDNGRIYTQDNLGRVIDQGGGQGASVLKNGALYSNGGLNYREVNGRVGNGTGNTTPAADKDTNTSNNVSSFVDTSAARNSTQNQLNSLDTQLVNMNQSSKSQFDQLMEQYIAENAANLTNFNDQTAKNEATRSGGISQSLAAAAQGGRGLRSALAAMGALGGTGQLLANRAIASSANKDVGGVNETFDTNATGLNSAWEKTEREQRQRKTDAETALENARVKNAGSIASQRQSLLRDMSGFWEQAGNKGAASEWLSKVSGENPAIERAALTATPAFQRSSAAFSPGALKNYLAGNQDMTVQADTGNSGLAINSPLYAARTRREEYA